MGHKPTKLQKAIRSFLSSEDNEMIIRELFDKYDVDKNGFIDNNEIDELLSDLVALYSATPEQQFEVKAFFRKLFDVNRDHKISFWVSKLIRTNNMKIGVHVYTSWIGYATTFTCGCDRSPLISKAVQ